MSNIAVKKTYEYMPESFEQQLKYAEIISKTSICPKDFQGKPNDVLVAIQMGAEVGLKPMQSLQNIAVINGRPSIWGDAALALVRAHKDFEWIDEKIENRVAICIIKRRNQPEQIRTFSFEEAEKAGLLNKPGVWKTYPNRMLQMRARGFCIRDTFADALKGLILAEEAQDYPTEKNITAHAEIVNSKINKIMEKAKPALANDLKDITETEAVNNNESAVFEIVELIEKSINTEELQKTKTQIKNLNNISDEQRADLTAKYNVRYKELRDSEVAKEFFNEE